MSRQRTAAATPLPAPARHAGSPGGAPPAPYRWALAARPDGGPDQVGTLADGAEPADLWYLPQLISCTGKILARSAAADLVFVGRSLDSMHDLLTGAFEHAAHRPATPALRRLPLSAPYCADAAARRRLRGHLAAAGLSPAALARRSRPVALVDVVHSGATFDTLFSELDLWIAESREPWPVVRRVLRFTGVTNRGRTSPHHWRWQQSPGSREWVRTLPAGHVVNVSLDWEAWSWFGNQQPKLGPSFPPRRWFDQDAAEAPRHGDLPAALAEARALVARGRDRDVRDEVVRAMAADPAFARREVRALASELRGHGAGRR